MLIVRYANLIVRYANLIVRYANLIVRYANLIVKFLKLVAPMPRRLSKTYKTIYIKHIKQQLWSSSNLHHKKTYYSSDELLKKV